MPLVLVVTAHAQAADEDRDFRSQGWPFEPRALPASPTRGLPPQDLRLRSDWHPRAPSCPQPQSRIVSVPYLLLPTSPSVSLSGGIAVRNLGGLPKLGGAQP